MEELSIPTPRPLPTASRFGRELVTLLVKTLNGKRCMQPLLEPLRVQIGHSILGSHQPVTAYEQPVPLRPVRSASGSLLPKSTPFVLRCASFRSASPYKIANIPDSSFSPHLITFSSTIFSFLGCDKSSVIDCTLILPQVN